MLSGGIRRSSFIGRAVVTVPESGQPLQVTVELKPHRDTPPAKSGRRKGIAKRTPKATVAGCLRPLPACLAGDRILLAKNVTFRDH